MERATRIGVHESGGRTVEDCLDNALEHAEDDDAAYWIRTALQHLHAERAVETTSSR